MSRDNGCLVFVKCYKLDTAEWKVLRSIPIVILLVVMRKSCASNLSSQYFIFRKFSGYIVWTHLN